jgi:hypothetical protein
MNTHIKRQKKYDEFCILLNQYKDHFIIGTVRYYIPWNKPFYIIMHLFAYVIALGSLIAKKGNWSHTFEVYKFGEDPRIVEAIGSGVNHAGLYDKFFSGKFKGKASFIFIPAELSDQNRAAHSDYIEHELIGKKYGALKAIKGFFGLLKKDTEKEVFCTDVTIDNYERMTSKELVGNNARQNPGKLRDILLLLGYKEIIIDSKNFK